MNWYMFSIFTWYVFVDLFLMYDPQHPKMSVEYWSVVTQLSWWAVVYYIQHILLCNMGQWFLIILMNDFLVYIPGIYCYFILIIFQIWVHGLHFCQKYIVNYIVITSPQTQRMMISWVSGSQNSKMHCCLKSTADMLCLVICR